MVGQLQQVPFNDPRWEPLDKGADLKGDVSDDGATLTHKLLGGTDWWRTTERHSTNGPTRGFYIDASEGVEISAKITVHPEVQYTSLVHPQLTRSDQATIFFYISPTRWVKAGLEYNNDSLWNGAVVCNPYSDWSIAKRSSSDSSRYTIAYRPNEIKVYLGEDMIREVKWFGPTEKDNAAAKQKEGKVFVGVMGCCPNEGGAHVSWSNFTVQKGVRLQ